jgi:isopentenyl-diphosphate delta-isomerase
MKDASDPNLTENIILVNEKDDVLGFEEKIKAHQYGFLHRAFSLILYRKIEKNQIEFLLQKRAPSKYHSPHKWSNTCCSHPSKDQIMEECVVRRLKEEMGIEKTPCQIQFLDKILYRLEVGNDLVEHEIDYVFVAQSTKEDKINPHPNEVCDYQWIELDDLKTKLKQKPDEFSAWLPFVLSIIDQHLFHFEQEGENLSTSLQSL